MSDLLSQTRHAMTQTDTKHEITTADILKFLKDNPDFIARNPDAVDLLIPPKKRPKKGEIADFQAYMIDRLKADKDEAVSTTREVVENTRANMNNQQRIHTAILRLMEAETFDDFVQTITMDLATHLGVDIAVLLLETNDIPHVVETGVRLLPTGTVDKWMRDKPVLLQGDINGIEPIYGGSATLVRSQILLRVDMMASGDMPASILAFGSRDPQMFHEGQATDQILFLTRIIERCFRYWIKFEGR